MRLLICITQAAMDGPENETEWVNCENRIVPESIKYLESRIDKFNLYDEKQPFLQIAGLDAKEKKPLDKLDFSSPSASTLFEHEASSSKVRLRGDAWKGVNLITLLNFHATGKVGQAIWNGENYNSATYPTPCIGHAHTLINGCNLLESIFFNLLTKNEVAAMPNGSWGQPVWDGFPASNNDFQAFKRATDTYLGRLVPLSRLILLDKEDNQCIIGPTPKTLTYTGLPEFRESTTTVLMSKKNEPYCMKISSEKHIWRDLGALLFLSRSMEGGGALNLRKINKLANYFDENKKLDIWVGGLELGAQAAKLHDMVEWNISIPFSFLFEDKSPLPIYSEGVELADSGGDSLGKGIAKYLEFSGNDKFQTNEKGVFIKTGKKDWELRKGLISKARTRYWQTLDNSYQILIDTVCDDAKSLDEDWYKNIFKAMHSAFRYACPCDTPRQIQAYAKAEQRLNLKKTENKDGQT